MYSYGDCDMRTDPNTSRSTVFVMYDIVYVRVKKYLGYVNYNMCYGYRINIGVFWPIFRVFDIENEIMIKLQG